MTNSPFATLEVFARTALMVVAHYCIYRLFTRQFLTTTEICTLIYFVAVGFFGVSGVYHRYYAHRSYKLNRFWQFIFTFAGLHTFQWGPLWWASYHRLHHAHADQPLDPHSPKHGFFRSYVGWFMRAQSMGTKLEVVNDFKQYPEIRWLDKYSFFFSLGILGSYIILGFYLNANHPFYFTRTNSLVDLYVVSVVYGFHVASLCNTFCHIAGPARYATGDQSRNNPFLFLINPSGETWHNNHHHNPRLAKMGVMWWEFDPVFYFLKFLNFLGIVKDLKEPSSKSSSSI